VLCNADRKLHPRFECPLTHISSVQFGTLLKHVLRRSGVGLGEEVGLQPPSKLSATDGGRAQLSWQRVPDNWGSDVEAPLAELSPGPRDHHVMTFGRTEVCPPTDVSDRLADVLEIRQAGATDAVKGSDGHLEQYPTSNQHYQVMSLFDAQYLRNAMRYTVTTEY